jgi:hypothetical protein
MSVIGFMRWRNVLWENVSDLEVHDRDVTGESFVENAIGGEMGEEGKVGL